ncbi:MAG: thioredoxin family protein [Thermodesulfovibrionales bacterium]
MAEEIVWGKSLGSALEQARKENKLVLAAFFSQGCEPCIKMNKCTLIADSVREYINKYFVAVKYESGLDSGQFMRFDITAKPAMLVLDSAGNEIFRKIGYFEPGIFIEKLEKARKKAAHKASTRAAVT